MHITTTRRDPARRIAFAGAFAAVASLVAGVAPAVASTEPPASEPPASDAAPADSAPLPDGTGVTIGVSFYDAQVIPLYVDLEVGMAAAAAETGAEISFSYAAFDPVAQVDQIETMITNGVDVILVTPLDPTILLTAYESARDAGIPIISFANKVADDAEDLFLGRNWAEFGAMNMESAIESIGGSGNIAFVTGPPELAVVQQVQAGWDEVLADHPDVTVVDSLVDPDMSTTVAVDLANTLFGSNDDIDAVLCTIDQICLGVAQAAQEQGIDPDTIFIASMDADEMALAQVVDGTGIDQTFSMKGVTWGRQAVIVALNYLAGDVPAEHSIPNEFIRIGPDNAADVTAEDLK